MNGMVISHPVSMFRPVYGDGRLFLLGFVLGVALALPTWGALSASQALIQQVPEHERLIVSTLASR